MTEIQYERAIWIKARIEKIDKLLEFLQKMSNNPEGPSKRKVELTEIAFTPEPESQYMYQDDIYCFMNALDSEKACLEHEFNRL